MLRPLYFRRRGVVVVEGGSENRTVQRLTHSLGFHTAWGHNSQPEMPRASPWEIDRLCFGGREMGESVDGWSQKRAPRQAQADTRRRERGIKPTRADVRRLEREFRRTQEGIRRRERCARVRLALRRQLRVRPAPLRATDMRQISVRTASKVRLSCARPVSWRLSARLRVRRRAADAARD